MASSDSDDGGGDTRGKRRRPYKRKKGMPLTSCLICFNASTPTSSDWIKVGGHYDPEYSCLNSHLSSIFVLRNYLDFPKEGCQRLLQKMGDVDPEEWFRLCASCSKQVQQCMEAFQQQSSPQQCQEEDKILGLRTKAHETLRASFYTEDCIRRTRIVDDEDEVDSAIWARTEVRKYFRGLLLPVQEKRQEDLSKLPKVCPVCNYEPDNPGFMKTHLGWCKPGDPSRRSTSSRSHPNHQSAEESNEPFFQCDKCDFIGKDRNARYTHMNKHKLDDNVVFLPSGHFSCTVCSAVFDKHLKIHLHLRQSHGEQLGLETYQCSYCGEFFNSQARLKAHTAKHTGSFRFSCDKCSYGCNDRRDMKKHKAARHFEDRGDPVHCEYCGRVYQTEGSLRSHLKNVHFNK